MNMTKNNGSSVIDFSNPEAAKSVLEHLGGETLLKEKYPRVYKAYQNTIEKHRSVQMSNANPINADGFSGGVIASPIRITTENEEVKNGMLGASDEKGFISGLTEVQGNDKWSVAYVTGEMKNVTDKKNPYTIDSYAEKIKDKNGFTRLLERTYDDIVTEEDQFIENMVHCTAVLKDNECLLSSIPYSDESTVYTVKGMSSMVSYISMLDPRSALNNNPILVAYARAADHFDYDYPNNRSYDAGGGKVDVKTILPIRGSITFAEGFVPKGFSPDNSQLPKLLYDNIGICTYKCTKDQLKAYFTVSKDNPQVVEFKLDENWNQPLNAKTYTDDHYATVKLNFSFRIEVEITGVGTLDIPITIYSSDTLPDKQRYYESVNSTVVCIPPIKMVWGCFAKDTMIEMSDNCQKMISDIAVGDKLLGSEGQELTVIDLVIGEEEEIYNIETMGGKKLRVTRQHPICTADGVVRANEIRPGMNLMCVDGSLDQVEFNYTTPYNDKVYNLLIEGGDNLIAANGIWAGDLNYQNAEIDSLNKEEPMSDEHKALTEEFEQLIDYLKTR